MFFAIDPSAPRSMESGHVLPRNVAQCAQHSLNVSLVCVHNVFQLWSTSDETEVWPGRGRRLYTYVVNLIQRVHIIYSRRCSSCLPLGENSDLEDGRRRASNSRRAYAGIYPEICIFHHEIFNREIRQRCILSRGQPNETKPLLNFQMSTQRSWRMWQFGNKAQSCGIHFPSFLKRKSLEGIYSENWTAVLFGRFLSTLLSKALIPCFQTSLFILAAVRDTGKV